MRELQDYIRKKDYDPDREQAYFLKLIEEVGELAEAIMRGNRVSVSGDITGTIDEELYDVLYYTLALANIHGVDMEESIKLKEAVNRRRYNDTLAL